ncbi:hypothetical protein J3A83DRAFT_4358692 [Scleroderma citrinum]
MPKSERALPTLQRIATLVIPIMRKRGWVLAVLSEFFPESPNLVDVNGGEKILLRLRPAWAPDTFYEEDQVVRVMLHEDEYGALQRSGYAGEGFFSPGYGLGAGVSHNLPVHLARAKAADAAEKRRQLNAVNRGGKLGGTVSALNNLSPRCQAAERRRQDELTCGLGSVALHEADKATKTSIVSRPTIDLTSDDSTIGPLNLKVANKTHRSSTNTQQSGSHSALSGQWACPVCTLINDDIVLQCAVCLSERPSNTSSGWTCLTCRESGIPDQFWACQFCGGIKTQR